MAKLEGLHTGEYGVYSYLNCTDSDGVAPNLSGYDGTNQIKMISPSGHKSVTITLAWNSDGTDGKVKFKFASDDTMDVSGVWEAQLFFVTAAGDQDKRSYPFTIPVGKSVG